MRGEAGHSRPGPSARRRDRCLSDAPSHDRRVTSEAVVNPAAKMRGNGLSVDSALFLEPMTRRLRLDLSHLVTEAAHA